MQWIIEWMLINIEELINLFIHLLSKTLAHEIQKQE